MKKIIVTKEQLQEYIENKKAEKIFNNILEDMYKNSKFLSEGISATKANKTIIENYGRKKLINSKVEKLLKEHGLIDENAGVL
jgi:hypothetical protein